MWRTIIIVKNLPSGDSLMEDKYGDHQTTVWHHVWLDCEINYEWATFYSEYECTPGYLGYFGICAIYILLALINDIGHKKNKNFCQAQFKP